MTVTTEEFKIIDSLTPATLQKNNAPPFLNDMHQIAWPSLLCLREDNNPPPLPPSN